MTARIRRSFCETARFRATSAMVGRFALIGPSEAVRCGLRTNAAQVKVQFPADVCVPAGGHGDRRGRGKPASGTGLSATKTW